MSFFARRRSKTSESGGQTGRNLQDGLFQIASQACHILVQVNNTHNVSYGGSNNVKNIAYSKCSLNESSSKSRATSSSTHQATSSVKPRSKYSENRSKDHDVVVLLPRRKSRTPLVRKHKLSTVSENARLDVHSSGGGVVAAAAAAAVEDEDLELWDQSGFMLRGDVDDPLTHTKWGAQGWCRPSCIPITVILILIVLVVLLPLLDHATDKYTSNGTIDWPYEISCTDNCSISFVETIPIGMKYNDSFMYVSHESTYDAWMKLIGLAQYKIEIASFYWTLKGEDVYPDNSAEKGEQIFRSLMEAGRDRNVQLRIAQNVPSQVSPNIDTEILSKKAHAQVKSLNFAGLLGGGVLHTKLWLVDRTHVYVGSANMDWRSLSQVKELGLLVLNCACLATDFAKIFDVYWKLAEDGKVPSTWPYSFSTKINIDSPMNINFTDNRYKTFIASSPPPFSPKGRTNDIDAILHCIEKAEKFLYISVMDYFPLTVYTPKVKYWPIIDDALRTAAVERKIRVRLLISSWKHSAKSEIYFLQSLKALTNSYPGVRIEVRLFIVPTSPDTDDIPFSRVNHNKYMVTDAAAYIGTSNWSGDYFIDTAGIGTVFESVGRQSSKNLRQQLEDIFNRDWYSAFSYPLNGSQPSSDASRITPTVGQRNNLQPLRRILT